MNYNKKNISEIISRMSILSTSWALNSILLNSITLSIIFTVNNGYWTLGVIIIIYLGSLLSVLTSYNYFILEKQSIFLQKCFKKEEIDGIFIGKNFHKLKTYLKNKELIKEYEKIKKIKIWKIWIIIWNNYYSIWIPFIINFFFIVFSFCKVFLFQ